MLRRPRNLQAGEVAVCVRLAVARPSLRRPATQRRHRLPTQSVHKITARAHAHFWSAGPSVGPPYSYSSRLALYGWVSRCSCNTSTIFGQRVRAITVETAARQTATIVSRSSKRRPTAASFVSPPQPSQIVVSPQFGVNSDIDAAALVRLAVKRAATFEVVPLVGDFLCKGGPIVRAWCSAQLTSADNKAIARSVLVEKERSMRNDPLFGFRQLVDIADKAHSPGINDPTKAV